VGTYFHGFRRFVYGGTLELGFPTTWKGRLNSRSAFEMDINVRFNGGPFLLGHIFFYAVGWRTRGAFLNAM
jgi:hypothetical protein